MTEKEYRTYPAVSCTELKRLKESPEKFKYRKENPIKAASAALAFGQALHKAVLEPNDFYSDFAVSPEFNRRTKQGKADYEAFCASNSGKTVISADDMSVISGISEAVLGHDFCKSLLSGKHEVPYFWTDELTGEQCKCRVDSITQINGVNYIVDLKTVASAETTAFMKKAVDYGYHVQAAMYTEGVKANIGGECQFVFIAVEKEPPFSINILAASDLFMTYGIDEFRHLIGIYHECKMSGNWYGYLGKFNEISSLGIPAWIAKEYEKG